MSTVFVTITLPSSHTEKSAVVLASKIAVEVSSGEFSKISRISLPSSAQTIGPKTFSILLRENKKKISGGVKGAPRYQMLW